MKKRLVKAIVPFLVILAFLFSAVPVMAEETETGSDGTAVFTFEDNEYHVSYERSEIVDGQLNVLISGFGSGLPIRNGKVVIIAWANAVIDGEEHEAYSVSAGGDGVYTYIFEIEALPEKVLLYPIESEEGLLLWEDNGVIPVEGIADNTAAADSETAAETESVSVPEELVGVWHGSGIPKGGGPAIDLSAVIEADGTGEYVFIQNDYTESYPFTISNEDSRFSVDIPEDNYLGISACGGTWEYADGVLKLDITTEFASGGSFSYTAECMKEGAEEQPAEPAEEPAEETPAVPETGAAEGEPYYTVLQALEDGSVLAKGSVGEAVRSFQDILNLFDGNISTDGIMGPATIKAMQRLQEGSGLDISDTLDAAGFEQLMERLRN